jgi:hypothetical protein
VFPESSFNYLKVPGKRNPPPPVFPNGPYGGRCPSPEPSSTYKSLVNEPPSRLPNVAVTEYNMYVASCCTNESFMSDNGTKERCPLGLKLLHILCTGTGHNKDRNYVLPYYVRNIKKFFG